MHQILEVGSTIMFEEHIVQVSGIQEISTHQALWWTKVCWTLFRGALAPYSYVLLLHQVSETFQF